jgi:hypothetical protein
VATRPALQPAPPAPGLDMATLMPAILRLAQALAAQMTAAPQPNEAADEANLPRYQPAPACAEPPSRPVRSRPIDLGEAVWDSESTLQSAGTTCVWEHR